MRAFSTIMLVVFLAGSVAGEVVPDPGLTLAVPVSNELTVAIVSIADFSPYEVILKRKPFGQPPVNPVAASAQAPNPALSFIRDWRMCAISEDESGVRVGLINIKDNANYFLYVGESDGGVELVSADYEKESAVLRSGTETGELNMGSGAGVGGSANPVTATTAASDQASATATRRMSYIERLRERRKAAEEMKQKEEEKRKEKEEKKSPASGEEVQKHLQDYNMELIRAGGDLGPPLPIPLTPEQDAQLVNEGVLPPAQ